MADTTINLLENISKGISPSYLGNFTKIVNLDLDSLPGGVVLQKTLSPSCPRGTDDYDTFTFTGAVDDKLTIAGSPDWLGSGYSIGGRVRLTTTGTLPAGLSTGTDYWMFGESGATVKLASSIANFNAGTAVNITDTGTGTHSIRLQPVTIMQKMLYTGISGNGAFLGIEDSDSLFMNSSYNTRAWTKITGNATTQVRGLGYWKNYAFIYGQTTGAIDVYGPVTTLASSAWTNAFKTIATSTTTMNPMLIASNDILYIGAANTIASIEQVSGKTFAPADASTYTFSTSALDLPSGENVVSMAQLGSYLYIATQNKGKSKIYPWDTVSSSFEEPIRFDGNLIDAIFSANNRLYIFCGDSAQIYVSNGSTVSLAAQIPATAGDNQIAITDQRFTFYPDAIFAKNNKLYFGLSSGTSTIGGLGIYTMNMDTGRVTLEYTTGSLYETNVKVYALCPWTSSNYSYFFASCYDGSKTTNYTYPVQYTIASFVNTGYLQTGLMTVGTKYQPRSFRFFEIQLGTELASGGSITLAYRTNLTDSFTTIGTMTYASDGAIASKIIENSSVEADQIQFKVTVASTVSTFSPQIKAIYAY